VNRGCRHRTFVHTHARIADIGSEAAAHVVGQVTRAKAQFEEASRGFKSQLAAEPDATNQEGETNPSHESAGDQ
jgi:hypothetical protein